MVLLNPLTASGASGTTWKFIRTCSLIALVNLGHILLHRLIKYRRLRDQSPAESRGVQLAHYSPCSMQFAVHFVEWFGQLHVNMLSSVIATEYVMC